MTDEQATRIANTLLLKVQELAAENNRLRAALEHYASKGVWDDNYYVPCKAGPDVARAALEAPRGS